MSKMPRSIHNDPAIVRRVDCLQIAMDLRSAINALTTVSGRLDSIEAHPDHVFGCAEMAGRIETILQVWASEQKIDDWPETARKVFTDQVNSR